MEQQNDDKTINAPPAVAVCERCGTEFTRRRPHGRFCSAYCRRVAWLARNPEKAAEIARKDRQRYRKFIISRGEG